MTYTAVSAVATVAVDAAPRPALTPELADRIAESVHASRAENTRRAYVSDWRRFGRWCTVHGHPSLPAHPLTVAAYLTDASEIRDQAGEREYAPATLARWVAAIGHRHRTAGYPAPGATEIVAATLSGIRRTYAAAGERPGSRSRPCWSTTSSVSSPRPAARSTAGRRRFSNAATVPCC